VSDFSGLAIIRVRLLLACDAGRACGISAVAFAIVPDYLYIGIRLDVLMILLHSLLPA
jgi:hypothetical protein